MAAGRGCVSIAPFKADTDYWPDDKQWMLNFRVKGLDALIEKAIADSGARFSLESEPARLRSGWLNGVKSMQMSYQG